MPKFVQLEPGSVLYDDYSETREFLVKFLGVKEHNIETFDVLFMHAWMTNGQFRWNGHTINIIQY